MSRDDIRPTAADAEPGIGEPTTRAADHIHVASALPAQRPSRTPSQATSTIRAVNSYLDEIAGMPTVTLDEIRDNLLNRLCDTFADERRARIEAGVPQSTLLMPRDLDAFTASTVLLRRVPIKMIDLPGGTTGRCRSQLGTYQRFGPKAGLYDLSRSARIRKVWELRPSSTMRQINSILRLLEMDAEAVRLTTNPNFIPVIAGVFDAACQELLPFSPDWVFTSKRQFNFDPSRPAEFQADRPS